MIANWTPIDEFYLSHYFYIFPCYIPELIIRDKSNDIFNFWNVEEKRTYRPKLLNFPKLILFPELNNHALAQNLNDQMRTCYLGVTLWGFNYLM